MLDKSSADQIEPPRNAPDPSGSHQGAQGHGAPGRELVTKSDDVLHARSASAAGRCWRGSSFGEGSSVVNESSTVFSESSRCRPPVRPILAKGRLLTAHAAARGMFVCLRHGLAVVECGRVWSTGIETMQPRAVCVGAWAEVCAARIGCGCVWLRVVDRGWV